MVIDILILVAVGVAVVMGFRRGMVQPLLVEIGFLGVLWVFISHWAGYSRLLERFLHVPPVLAGVVIVVVAGIVAYGGGRLGGLIHRMPLVQGADGLLGVFVHGFIAVMICYFFLGALVAIDKAFGPVLNGAQANVAQARTARTALLSHPLVSKLVDRRDLDILVQRARQPGGARIADLPSLQQLETAYGDFAQPQLLSSRLAPIVLAIGKPVPGLGHYGPSDLPRRVSPSPSATPSPSASAQP